MNSNKNVPIFIHYCIDLIRNEIGEGDLLNKYEKYKYNRNITMVNIVNCRRNFNLI